MIFSELEYFLFFGFVFFIYWYLLPIFSKDRNFLFQGFLLFVSYYFYMSWDYRFGSLILLSTLIDFVLAIYINESDSKNKRLFFLYLSLFLNLICVLGFFKYYLFFANSINQILGNKYLPILEIILPVGISFFTFQSMSYTIDVYRKEIPVEKSFLRFALFVSFFPQLVAGPIVTAKTFLPQLETHKKIEDIDFKLAIRFFLMGYFKKIIISDNVSPIVDVLFKSPEVYSGISIWIANAFFVIQLYGDFSGYSDMAFGSALLLGYKLPENFYLPLKPTSVTDFWRRWHITLGTWLRDYIYISFGGSKKGVFIHKFNLFMTMFIGGIWHGANWTYFFWGAFMGSFLAFESAIKNYTEKFWKNLPKKFHPTFLFLSWIYGLGAVTFACALFRSENMSMAKIMMEKMIFMESGEFIRPYMLKTFFVMVIVLFISNIIGHYIFEKKKAFTINSKLEFFVYPILILIIAYFSNDNELAFVYFQF